MSLFGSLYVGSSGLQSSQNALNTTAHNMTNVDTAGYTRQQIVLGTRSYNTLSVSASAVAQQQYGLGVYYSQVRQVRDVFLDKIYRRESGRSAFYETNTKVLEEVEDLFGEFQGVEFSSAMKGLWESVEELAKEPSKLTNQNLFVSSAAQFLTRAQLVYDGLCDQQDNLNAQVKKSVKTINDYGKKLAELNNKIMKIEAGGVEHANDLRDTRNSILDELSKLGNINYSEDFHGVVSVQFEGVDFVSADTVNELALYEDEVTGFYTPYWSQLASTKTNARGEQVLDLDAARLYDPTQTIRSDMNTDVGSLRSILVARGERRANYKDIENEDYYNSNVSQSILMNVQAEFDQLIHKVAVGINEVLRKAAESEPDTDYLKDENGNPYQLFQMIANDPDVGFTISNMTVNEELTREPSKLSFRLKDGSEDEKCIQGLQDLFTEETHTLNPNLQTRVNLRSYYANLVVQVGNTGEYNKDNAAAQEKAVNEAFSAREQVLGVSSDEELEFMIKFQNAYNASSRYINVINEMMEHILNTLGR